MTVLAGIMSRIPGMPIAEETRKSLRRLISRHHGDKVLEFGDTQAFLAKIDIGAFGAPAAQRDIAGNVTLLAGLPLLDHSCSSRSADVQKLHGQWSGSDWSGLTKCRGTFCAIHYSPSQQSICLIADKLGVRPIYYWVSPKLIVFATALRVLEGLADVPQDMDLRGASEIACFGYPLGERTGYAGIYTIGAGQVVQISAKTVLKTHYWRWDRLPQFVGDSGQLSQEVYRRFSSAVACRQGGEQMAVAFLSGGLDSRSIAAALREMGTDLYTLNYALEGTEDRVFAAEIARALGTRHFELMPSGTYEDIYTGGAYNQPRVSDWFESVAHPRYAQLRRLVWSGDGGSVGLGHVYLDGKTIELARAGNTDAAMNAFASYNRFGIPTRILEAALAGSISRFPGEGIREELERLDCDDRGRAFHLFLMLNDQRRHLANFFENIDIDRLEFHLPFYDSDFLEPILSSRVDEFLKHGFYMEWLRNFPPAVLSVPWQAYPGHIPCFLPSPQGLRYQWTDYYNARVLRQLERSLLQEIDNSLAVRHFPTTVVNRSKLRLVTWLTRMGIRDCRHLLKVAAVYCRYSPKRSTDAMSAAS